MRLLLMSFVSMGTAVTFAQEPTATVTIRVMDQDGYAIERCRVDRFVGKRYGDMSSHFSGTRGTQIPYDIYTYSITRVGSVRGTAEVFSPEVFVAVSASRPLLISGASADTAMPTGYAVRGKIEPMPAEKSEIDPIWIRLSPIHGDRKIDVSVDPSGEFRIYQWLYGRYVLSVIQGNDVLHVQPITFRPVRSQFTIRLPSQPPQVIPVQEERETRGR